MTFAVAVSLAFFAALVLAVSLQLLAASGHFPSAARGPAMKSGPAVLLLWASLAITLAAFAAGVLAGSERLPWQGLIIAGGLALLCAPLILQQCPDRFVDGRAAVVTFAAAAAAFALLLAIGSNCGASESAPPSAGALILHPLCG
jgi:hypothetical protein